MTWNTGETFREESVAIRGPAGTLAGTLSLPTAGATRGAVLILAGSGSGDRDGNQKQLRTNVYRDLAHEMSRQGFVTLRYDKRGVGASAGDGYSVGMWDRVDDAAAAVAYLRGRSQDTALPIIILGHSEGCIIGTAVNARQRMDGLVLLAAPCESLAATSPRQQAGAIEDLRRMPGFAGALVRALRVPERQSRKAEAVMRRLLTSERPWIRVSGVKLNAKWIREHMAYDIASDLPKVTCPTLAITGAKDVQVLPEHAQKIAETVGGPGEWRIIPDMTHILRRTRGNVNMINLVKLYRQQCLEPIDEELLQVLEAWLGRYFPSRSEPAGAAGP